MIILEGPDGSGKTALADVLSEKFPRLSYIHSPGYSSNLPQWLEEHLQRAKRTRRRNILYDRFFFSELIYGPALRGALVYPPGWAQQMISTLFLDVQPLIILCLPSLAQVKRGAQTQAHLPGACEHIELVWGLYQLVMPRWTYWAKYFITYNWSNLNLVEEAVKEYLGERT